MKLEPDSIHTYGNSDDIASITQLPVQHTDRICTDIFCTILTTLLAICIFISSVILLDL